MDKRLIAGLLSAAALAVPAAALADPGHGAGRDHAPSKPTAKSKHERTGKAKKAKKVMFIFKGSFTAPGTVAVASGNARVRMGGFVGQAVSFDVSAAKIVAADTNGDAKVDLSDVKDGDLVLIQARLPKTTRFAGAADGATAEPVVARKLIDRTNAAEPDEDPAT